MEYSEGLARTSAAIERLLPKNLSVSLPRSVSGAGGGNGGGVSLLVAFSGGADSSLLLRMAADWAKANHGSVAAAHVNHGIRGDEAIRDREFCRAQADALGIRLFVLDADVPEAARLTRESLEVAARRIRYDFFETVMRREQIPVLLTAHNADDQLETLIFRLARGTGPAGLCGIPEIRELSGVSTCAYQMSESPGEPPDGSPDRPTDEPTDGQNGLGAKPGAQTDADGQTGAFTGAGKQIGAPGAPCQNEKLWVIRPLLGLSKREILEICRAEGIPFVTDSTNTDISYARNRIRQKVIPELEALFDRPQAAADRFCHAQALDQAYLESETERVLASIRQTPGKSGTSDAAHGKPAAFDPGLSKSRTADAAADRSEVRLYPLSGLAPLPTALRRRVLRRLLRDEGLAPEAGHILSADALISDYEADTAPGVPGALDTNGTFDAAEVTDATGATDVQGAIGAGNTFDTRTYAGLPIFNGRALSLTVPGGGRVCLTNDPQKGVCLAILHETAPGLKTSDTGTTAVKTSAGSPAGSAGGEWFLPLAPGVYRVPAPSNGFTVGEPEPHVLELAVVFHEKNSPAPDMNANIYNSDTGRELSHATILLYIPAPIDATPDGTATADGQLDGRPDGIPGFFFRFRRPGDRLLLRRMHRDLRKNLSETGWPPDLRARLPLLICAQGAAEGPTCGPVTSPAHGPANRQDTPPAPDRDSNRNGTEEVIWVPGVGVRDGYDFAPANSSEPRGTRSNRAIPVEISLRLRFGR